ncbi:hypothetical protein [Blautia producta]|uniref:hypothetical protein n=1 Tax=Blautia producta TaxID=33035 RepID=UPI003562CACB
MHYTTVKDAAICTALAASTGWWQPRDAPQAVMCYIFIFVLLVVAFEVARNYQERRERNESRRITENIRST